jgi:hypothetical protein
MNGIADRRPMQSNVLLGVSRQASRASTRPSNWIEPMWAAGPSARSRRTDAEARRPGHPRMPDESRSMPGGDASSVAGRSSQACSEREFSSSTPASSLQPSWAAPREWFSRSSPRPEARTWRRVADPLVSDTVADYLWGVDSSRAPAQVVQVLQHANEALTVGRASGTASGVSHWQDLILPRLLTTLHAQGLLASPVEGHLGPLLAHDAIVRGSGRAERDPLRTITGGFFPWYTAGGNHRKARSMLMKMTKHCPRPSDKV